MNVLPLHLHMVVAAAAVLHNLQEVLHNHIQNYRSSRKRDDQYL